MSLRSDAYRLFLLGWSRNEIAVHLGIKLEEVDSYIRSVESEVSRIRAALDDGQPKAEVAAWAKLPVHLVWAIWLNGRDDAERLKLLKINLRPYDVWNFTSCHTLMGTAHPGRIPGELVSHVLYFFTEPGDLVVDPMVGSGTTLDACLLMGRRCRGYDIDLRHGRVDIEHHDLSDGWPETVKGASLVFWDPPYFSKMDRSNIGKNGYIEGSISGMAPAEYLSWLEDRFKELYALTRPGTKLAFLMSDWDPENAKKFNNSPGIYVWDYSDRLRKAGWKLLRQIQCPLSTQQIHPGIIIKFRESKRLARLVRYLIVARR